MPDRGCALDALLIRHPDPGAVEAQLRSAGADEIPGVRVERAEMPGLQLRVRTPAGMVATL
jgi:hypothetical protein